MGDNLLEKIPIAILIILSLFPFYQIGAIGAGDIKCLAMINFYLTFDQFLKAVFFSFFIALILIGIKYICRCLSTLKFFKYYSKFKIRFCSYCTSFFKTDFPIKKTIERNKIRMAFPILLGVFISVGGTYL